LLLEHIQRWNGWRSLLPPSNDSGGKGTGGARVFVGKRDNN